MATKTRKRNARRSTAMVFNPAGRVLAGGSRINPRRRRRRRTTRRRYSARRRNPIAMRATTVRRRRNPLRRRNPATLSGLLVTSVMAGLSITVFDILTAKFIPQGSPLLRIGTKLGGAYIFQSGMARRVPLLGKYSNEVALVLGVSAAIDALKLWVLPAVSPALNSIGLAVPDASGMGDVYGNAFTPQYQPFS